MFEDYLLFCFGFTVVCSVVTLLLLDSTVFVETLGSLAVMFEAMLGLPQLLQNLQNRSTRGMRYGAQAGHNELCRIVMGFCTVKPSGALVTSYGKELHLSKGPGIPLGFLCFFPHVLYYFTVTFTALMLPVYLLWH